MNDTTEKTAPAGAIDQIGECLSRIIHAFAEADDEAKIFMAKSDIKDGFWRMDYAAGEEWNFTYVLPQEEGEPLSLVVPTSLQMGWVESPPYFCAATETSRDISTEYIETEVNSLHRHKFEHYVVGAPAYTNLPKSGQDPQGFWYIFEVYVDDFMSLVIPVSREQLRHVANAIMHGIHDVFSPNNSDAEDPISEKKMKKGEGLYDTKKTLLGFDFDGARFTHVGARVSFEVLLASFGLEQDARLSRLGTVVHYLDAGGIPAPEAGGLEAVLAGLRELHADDNTLLDLACTVFDALFEQDLKADAYSQNRFSGDQTLVD